MKTVTAALVILSAGLFGAVFPLAKTLLADVDPLALAGFLYLAGGLGVGALRVVLSATGRASRREAGLDRRDLPWLGLSILLGGVSGPILLLFGLKQSPAHVASLLVNTEMLFTVLLAILFFGDFLVGREILGACLLGLGAVLISLDGAASGGDASLWSGPALLLSAALCWGFDNNVTQRISARDPLQIAAVKGTVAGIVNLGLAAGLSVSLSWSPRTIAFAAVVGFFSYGLSQVFYVVGLRELGAARTAALFATAPVFGVILSWALRGESPARWAATGGALMIPGTWLLLGAKHAHRHVHEPMEHEHRHVHDEHHRHDHRGDEGPEPHSHRHRHDRLEHDHPHVADLHHRHRHG